MSSLPESMHHAASRFLLMLLGDVSLPPLAAFAFEQILIAERRDGAFGHRAFARDEGWRMLLILFVASAGSYQLAPDVFEMIGLADDATTARWVQFFVDQELVLEVDGGLVLTEAATGKLSNVLRS